MEKNYEAPLMEVMTVRIEAGFAQSITGTGEPPVDGDHYSVF